MIELQRADKQVVNWNLVGGSDRYCITVWARERAVMVAYTDLQVVNIINRYALNVVDSYVSHERRRKKFPERVLVD